MVSIGKWLLVSLCLGLVICHAKEAETDMGHGRNHHKHSSEKTEKAVQKLVGGYLMVDKWSNGKRVGLTQLQGLANSAETLPLNRVLLAFLSPNMVYTPGDETLEFTGMTITDEDDFGYEALKESITKLQAGGVEVFLSMGGWNYNCFPYAYARYSVGGYGPKAPNYYKIDDYGNGDINNCNEDNQYCYSCAKAEAPVLPKKKHGKNKVAPKPASPGNFAIFPEPDHSLNWASAQDFVEGNMFPEADAKWSSDMIPGREWTDPVSGLTVDIPGSDRFAEMERDPYEDMVYLAKDLGVAGVDVDYEEFWHVDYHKAGPDGGPWNLTQTVYKYAAIIKDLKLSIRDIYPELKLSTAAGAVGAWEGQWWGGNMKGLLLKVKQNYPGLIDFMSKGANAGGINVMSYDLSNDKDHYECPAPDACSLDTQVDFYMKTFADAGIPANVGYEIGTPAYPDPARDKTHSMPLTMTMLSNIAEYTQPEYNGGFFWEMYKDTDGHSNADPTAVAQSICKTMIPDSPRCIGTIPAFNYGSSSSEEAEVTVEKTEKNGKKHKKNKKVRTAKETKKLLKKLHKQFLEA